MMELCDRVIVVAREDKFGKSVSFDRARLTVEERTDGVGQQIYGRSSGYVRG